MKNLATSKDLLPMPIMQILLGWPSAAKVFISHRMACIGCSFSRFHRLKDAIEIYHLDQAALCSELIQAIAGVGGDTTCGEQI
jgi:hybrid cluster-associated redox disulfide protein